VSSRVEARPKYSNEQVVVPFDFISRLGPTETISTKVVTCVVYSGTDPSPSSMISGAASHSGTIVSQLVIGGVAGVIYELHCTITTSLGQTLILSAYLAVLPATLP
jgi:hypothetical protein